MFFLLLCACSAWALDAKTPLLTARRRHTAIDLRCHGLSGFGVQHRRGCISGTSHAPGELAEQLANAFCEAWLFEKCTIGARRGEPMLKGRL